MLRRTLEKEGFTVDEAENGRVALEKLRQKQPLLILLDLLMPEMDGFEFVARLEKHEQGRAIPIIVITARDTTQKERQSLKRHVKAVLKKGEYSREQLLKRVRDLVAAHVPRKSGRGGSSEEGSQQPLGDG